MFKYVNSFDAQRTTTCVYQLFSMWCKLSVYFRHVHHTICAHNSLQLQSIAMTIYQSRTSAQCGNIVTCGFFNIISPCFLLSASCLLVYTYWCFIISNLYMYFLIPSKEYCFVLTVLCNHKKNEIIVISKKAEIPSCNCKCELC